MSLCVSGDTEKTQSAGKPGRRVYTVLPPPADYKTESEKSITLPQLESINSDKDPAGKTIIIIHLCTRDVRHKAGKDLQCGVSPGWRSSGLSLPADGNN